MFSVTLRRENTRFLKVACRLTGTPGASLLRARPSPRRRGPEAHRLQRTRAPSGGQVPSSRWPRLNARGPRAGPRGCHGAEESDFSERLCGHRPHSRFLCVSSFTPEWGCIAHLRGARGARYGTLGGWASVAGTRLACPSPAWTSASRLRAVVVFASCPIRIASLSPSRVS